MTAEIRIERRPASAYLYRMVKPVYLDYNASAPVKPEVAEAVTAALALTGNPSSVHGWGRAGRGLIEEARDKLAALVGARPQDVVFTSGGTEANNQALRCMVGVGRILISAVEHDSVLAAANASGRPVMHIPVDANGVIDLAVLRQLLAEGPSEGKTLVSVMLANNETGVVQPVAEAAALAHEFGGLFHTDAVQGPGKLAFDFATLDADLMTISGHKFGAPHGVGALIHRPGLDVPPFVAGGGQEGARRSGTENLPGIAGLGKAAELAADSLAQSGAIEALRDRLEAEILEISPQSRAFGAGAARLPNTSCLAMPGVAGEMQVIAFDLSGFAVSAGSACSSGKVKKVRALEAMGLPESVAADAIRIGLGADTSGEDIDGFVAAWRVLFERSGRPQATKATSAAE